MHRSNLSYLFTPPTTAPTSAVATMPAIDGFADFKEHLFQSMRFG